MNPKIKYTLASLSAVFALAVTPPIAIIVESAINLERMTTEMNEKLKARTKEVDEELELAVSASIAKNNGCLQKEAFPYLAFAETFEDWSNRLSFSSRLSTPLKNIKNNSELRGFINGLKCVAF